jgi:hypothetical protein
MRAVGRPQPIQTFLDPLDRTALRQIERCHLESVASLPSVFHPASSYQRIPYLREAECRTRLFREERQNRFRFRRESAFSHGTKAPSCPAE